MELEEFEVTYTQTMTVRIIVRARSEEHIRQMWKDQEGLSPVAIRSSIKSELVDIQKPPLDLKTIQDNQLLGVRAIPGRGTCVVQRFIYSCGLLVDFKVDGIISVDYKARYCYDTAKDAIEALDTWDGEGDPPGDWIKEKVSDRYGPGAKTDAAT